MGICNGNGVGGVFIRRLLGSELDSEMGRKWILSRRFMKIKPGEKCRDKKNNYEKRNLLPPVPELKQYRLPLSLARVLSRSNLISGNRGIASLCPQ